MTTTTKNRKINKIWFKVRNHFLPLLDTHFQPHSKFYKIYNRNTVNTSYSCMLNMEKNIISRNHKITYPKTITKKGTCKCIDKAKCLLSQNCLNSNIIYKAVLTSIKPKMHRKDLLLHVKTSSTSS